MFIFCEFCVGENYRIKYLSESIPAKSTVSKTGSLHNVLTATILVFYIGNSGYYDKTKE